MIRNTAVVIGGVVLSGLLTALMGWLIAQSDDMRLLQDVSEARLAHQSIPADKADAAWDAIARAHRRGTWVYAPLVALTVGVFVGVLAGSWPWQLGVVAAAPFAFIFSVDVHGVFPGLGILASYLTVAGVGAWAGSRLRSWLGAGHGRPTKS